MICCKEAREILVEVARGEIVSASRQEVLDEHTESCAVCRLRLINERRLSAALGAVASGTASAAEGVASAAVKRALMVEFRRQRVVIPIRRSRFVWAAVVGIAAALIVAVLIAMISGQQKTFIAKAPPPPRAVVAPPLSRPPVVPRVAAPVARLGKPRRIPRSPVPHLEEPPEVATEFFELPFAEPLRPEERADIFRIQVPRASMAVFGLPVSGGRLDSRISADIVAGEDGVVRAIRFIR